MLDLGGVVGWGGGDWYAAVGYGWGRRACLYSVSVFSLFCSVGRVATRTPLRATSLVTDSDITETEQVRDCV